MLLYSILMTLHITGGARRLQFAHAGLDLRSPRSKMGSVLFKSELVKSNLTYTVGKANELGAAYAADG